MAISLRGLLELASFSTSSSAASCFQHLGLLALPARKVLPLSDNLDDLSLGQ